MMKRCLVLEDGTVFYGTAFGANSPLPEELISSDASNRCAGELVFNTGMTGYPEILTDPSYTGQIVMVTCPHAGNYGIDPAWSETGPGVPSGDIQPDGLVVRALHTGPLPHGRQTLDEYLRDRGVPGISEVDTRAVTLGIRSAGSPRAVLVSPDMEDRGLSSEGLRKCLEFLEDFPGMEGRDLVELVKCHEVIDLSGPDRPRILLVDTGLKANIPRNLLNRGCGVKVVPPGLSAEELLSMEPDGILLTNGPGDPAVLKGLIDETAKLAGRVPLFGICLGHQIISLALGAKTKKMKFGHHGCNHPVRDEQTGRVFVTSQNHGFMVEEESLAPGMSVWFRNANDGTIEGLRYDKLGILSVQFHPEAAPGPRETGRLFDTFLEMIPSFRRT